MIGILSDSHDNLVAVKEAVRLFRGLDCQLVIHAGDFVAPFAAKELHHLPCRVKAVYGNCDGEKEGLAAAIEPVGEIKEPPFLFDWKGLHFLLMHVDYDLDVLLSRHNPDVLVCGHTHKPLVSARRKTLMINPGETGGWVTGQRTVAVLNPETKEADIVSI